MSANYKMIALQIGDKVKWIKTEKEINLAAQSVFNFNMKEIRISDSVTSSRSRLFSNWILTLALQKAELDQKNKKLIQFLETLFDNRISEELNSILEKAGVLISSQEFVQRDYHGQI